MKALLVADTDSSVRKLSECVNPYGFDVIQYHSALKALDNIEEIKPDAIFISTGDFPRHWKTIVQFVRADPSRDDTVIILLINGRFTADDADKAVHIGVQAIISETLDAANDEHQLLQVFSRYRHVGPGVPGFSAPVGGKAVFLFTNPVSDTIITGKVENLSVAEIVFKPDAPSMTSDLAAGDLLEACSLKLGENIVSAKCRVRKNAGLLILEIVDPDESLIESINGFIAG